MVRGGQERFARVGKNGPSQVRIPFLFMQTVAYECFTKKTETFFHLPPVSHEQLTRMRKPPPRISLPLSLLSPPPRRR